MTVDAASFAVDMKIQSNMSRHVTLRCEAYCSLLHVVEVPLRW